MDYSAQGSARFYFLLNSFHIHTQNMSVYMHIIYNALIDIYRMLIYLYIYLLYIFWFYSLETKSIQ